MDDAALKRALFGRCVAIARGIGADMAWIADAAGILPAPKVHAALAGGGLARMELADIAALFVALHQAEGHEQFMRLHEDRVIPLPRLVYDARTASPMPVYQGELDDIPW